MISDNVENPATHAPSREKPRLARLLWRIAIGIGILTVVLIVSFICIDNRVVTSDPKEDLAESAQQDLERRHFQPLSGELEALLNDPTYESIPTQTHPLLQKSAPPFALKDVDDKEWSLSQELEAGPVVLVFYYGYHCDHCVSQLFGLHKDIEKFRELGVNVVAISGDPPELTRERFKKYGAFAFPVLSDSGNSVAKLYGTFVPNPKGKDDGDLMHGTFIVSREGRVIWVNRGDEPFTENRTLLMELYRLGPRTSMKKP